jgi:hypothetical protein
MGVKKSPAFPFINHFGSDNIMTITSRSSLTVVPTSASWTVSLENRNMPRGAFREIGGTDRQFYELL